MNLRRLAWFRAALALAAISLVAMATAAAAELREFDAGSPAAIRVAHPGEAFVLAFWSTQCEPCREEMALWKSVLRKNPKLAVILVATDPPSERETIRRFLARYSPGPVQTWAFADEFDERLRYAVDPAWRGELPRTYFYDSAHQPTAKSGLLDQAWIEDWISRQAKAGRKP